jgi:hypothetical protein
LIETKINYTAFQEEPTYSYGGYRIANIYYLSQSGIDNRYFVDLPPASLTFFFFEMEV